MAFAAQILLAISPSSFTLAQFLAPALWGKAPAKALARDKVLSKVKVPVKDQVLGLARD